MITYYKKRIGDKKIKQISSIEIGAWVNVINPSQKEIKQLCKKLGLDRRSLFSGLDENEIPRLDFIGQNIYLFTKDVLLSQKTQTFLIVIGPDFFLTLSQERPSFLNKILKGKIELFTTQKLKALIEILFLINGSLEKATEKIIREVQLKKLKKTELSDSDLEALLEEEELLNRLISSYQYIVLVYNRAVKKIHFLKVDEELLEDLIEETDQGFNLCRSALKNISNIREYYTILLSNRLNKTISILTVFTVLISLPNLVAGLYGMNIALPFAENPLAFWYIIGLNFIGLIFVIFAFKKNKII